MISQSTPDDNLLWSGGRKASQTSGLRERAGVREKDVCPYMCVRVRESGGEGEKARERGGVFELRLLAPVSRK